MDVRTNYRARQGLLLLFCLFLFCWFLFCFLFLFLFLWSCFFFNSTSVRAQHTGGRTSTTRAGKAVATPAKMN